MEGTRFSIYNERTQAKFPLLGLKFKNTSGLHLMQGPITVFEGSNYAGDARILDVEPNEERLISYAVDLGTEVNPVPSSDNGRYTIIRYNQGLLYTATKDRETKTYTIVNRNDQERAVLIEHPVRNDFHLTDTDKPAETASDVYRFEVKVSAGKTVAQTVTEERDGVVTYHLTDLDDDAIRRFQSPGRQRGDEKGTATSDGAALGGGADAARPGRSGAAVEGRDRRSGAAAGQPQGDAADGGRLQTLSR